MDFNDSAGYSDVVITDIPCPNCCGHIASREHEDTGWTQYECESCDFFAETGDISDPPSTIDTIAIRMREFLWPNGQLAILILAVVGLVVGSEPVMNNALVFFASAFAIPIAAGGQFDAHLFCSDCLQEVSDCDEWCGNCGRFLEEPLSRVDPDATPIHVQAGAVISKKTPGWFSPNLLGFKLTTEGVHSVAQRILSVPLPWKKFFKIGGFLGVVTYILVTIGAVGFVLDIAYSVLFEPSSSGGSESSTPVTNTVLLAWTYIIVSLTIVVAIHEIGHALAFEFYGVHIEELGFGFMAIIPMVGWVEPEFSDHLSPFKKIQCSFAGIFLNIVTFVVLLPIAYSVTDGFSIGMEAAAATLHPIANLVFWICILSPLMAIPNAAPILGMDGHHIQNALLEAVEERSDRIGESIQADAAKVTHAVIIGPPVAAIIISLVS